VTRKKYVLYHSCWRQGGSLGSWRSSTPTATAPHHVDAAAAPAHLMDDEIPRLVGWCRAR
jgi:hypothetical protein